MKTPPPAYPSPAHQEHLVSSGEVITLFTRTGWGGRFGGKEGGRGGEEFFQQVQRVRLWWGERGTLIVRSTARPRHRPGPPPRACRLPTLLSFRRPSSEKFPPHHAGSTAGRRLPPPSPRARWGSAQGLPQPRPRHSTVVGSCIAARN